MKLNAQRIKEIYEGKVARKYDFSLAPFFAHWKKRAIEDSSLKFGDHVLVFCCGTGLDFPHILDRIGPEGKIYGIDFSKTMLSVAAEKTERNGWKNVALIHSDVTTFTGKLPIKADVGICTLGLSIIPEYQTAYSNLLSGIKNGGEIIIGDMQLASGWLANFNPFTLFLARKYGGTREGHQNSQVILELMQGGLSEIRKKEFFFGAYFYCIGSIKPSN